MFYSCNLKTNDAILYIDPPLSYLPAQANAWNLLPNVQHNTIQRKARDTENKWKQDFQPSRSSQRHKQGAHCNRCHDHHGSCICEEQDPKAVKWEYEAHCERLGQSQKDLKEQQMHMMCDLERDIDVTYIPIKDAELRYCDGS